MEPNNRLATLSQGFLPEGSHIRHAFMCQTAPNVWFFVVNYLTYLTIFWIKYRIVCVTDGAIYVLRGTKFAIKPREVIATLPRATQLGPVSGRWAKIQLMDERHWVHQRFHPEIIAADLEAR
jgi:hypothetical protein